MSVYVLTGPESSGKSTLAAQLSGHLGAGLVSEAARAYLAALPDPYQPGDLLRVAARQIQLEMQAWQAHPAPHTLICDTDLQVLYIWWQVKYGPAPVSLVENYRAQGPRHYLLCAPDLPWTPDPQREHPHSRDMLFALYEADLKRRGLPYDVIRGLGPARLDAAIQAVAAVQGTAGVQ